MKLISTTPVKEDFSTPAWLQSLGYNPNFDYSWLAECYDSSAYAIYKLNDDVFTTYTVAAVFGKLYIFEMDKGSRDIEHEFENEYESFIPIEKKQQKSSKKQQLVHTRKKIYIQKFNKNADFIGF